jgi:hypothetical protein
MKRILFLFLVLLFAARGYAATFGKTDIGGSNVSTSDDIRGCQGTPASNGSATSMTAYIDGWGAGEKIKFALYNASDDSLVASTVESEVGGATGWHTLSFSPAVTVSSSTTYLLAVYADSFMSFFRDTEAGEYPNQNNTGYPTWPDPVVTSTGYQFSVYCTYTAVSTTAGARSRYSNGYRASYRNRYN